MFPLDLIYCTSIFQLDVSAISTPHVHHTVLSASRAAKSPASGVAKPHAMQQPELLCILLSSALITAMKIRLKWTDHLQLYTKRALCPSGTLLWGKLSIVTIVKSPVHYS